MNMINIIETVLFITIGGFAVYFEINNKLFKKAGELINQAEEKFENKTERFDWCVDMLYSFLPVPLRIIFKYIPKPMVEQIIQNVFDDMRSFAKKRFDKVIDTTTDKLDEIQSIFVEKPDMEESELDTGETK